MSVMDRVIAVRDVENQGVLLPGKTQGTVHHRPVLGEIRNKVQNRKENDQKLKHPNSGIAFSKSVVQPLKIGLGSKVLYHKAEVHNSKQAVQLGKSVPLALKIVQGSLVHPIKAELPPKNAVLLGKSKVAGTISNKKPVSSSDIESIPHHNTDTTVLTLNQQKIRDVDENDHKDIFLLGKYVCDIYKYLLELEIKIPIKYDFLNGTNVTSGMRATLIDWLLDVQMHYSFLLETLHLAVSIIDRFLQNSGIIQRKNFQLVGITAMLLACKFEETYYPEISDFIYMTDNAYSKQQVLDLEIQIVKKLDFRLGRPISLTFLRRLSKIVQADQLMHTLGKYFIELALLELPLAYARPSQVAAAAIYIALCLKAEEVRADLWTPTLQYYSTYSLEDFQSVTKKLATAIKEAPNSKYKSIRSKYMKTEFLSVSSCRGVMPDSSVLIKLSNMN